MGVFLEAVFGINIFFFFFSVLFSTFSSDSESTLLLTSNVIELRFCVTVLHVKKIIHKMLLITLAYI